MGAATELIALRSAPPAFSAAEAEHSARDLYALTVAARSLPGERDANFHLRAADGREYVLKVIDPAAAQQTVDCQIEVLRHLAAHGRELPIPRVVLTTRGEATGAVVGRDGSVYTACLIGFLPGRLLAESVATERVLEQVGVTLARLDRALQGFFHPALGQRIAWDVRRLPELLEHTSCIGSAAVRLNVERAVAAFLDCRPALDGLRGQAIHGDCHAQNLLIDTGASGVSGILDFGDMIHAPRILEPAVAMSELLSQALAPLGAVGALLAGYGREQPLEESEIEVLYALIAARHAATLLVHAWRRRHDPAASAHGGDAGAGTHTARSLETLLEVGRGALTREWQAAAAGSRAVVWAGADARVDLGTRRRLMGKGSELFYEKPLHLVRGRGVWLFDPRGQAYLDVYNNVPHVGHAHPTVVRALQSQVALLATHSRYLHSGILEYAERLTARLPARLDTCIFVNSGSEANDVAWRIARFATGHKGALVMEHAYHGITDAVAALTPSTGQPRDAHVATLAAPPPGLRVHAASGEAEPLAAARADVARAVATLASRGFEPAAFYIDTAMTSSGVYDPPAAWAATVAAELRAAGALIVADEVQYGMGRPGSNFWGFERRGLEPDIVTLGKPVANGYPMGVVIANRELIESFQAKFGLFSTFGGSAVAAAAALAVLDVLDREQLQANAAGTGVYLRRLLEEVAGSHACLGELRGTGFLLGLQVHAVAGRAAREVARRIINTLAAEEKILIGYEGPNVDILKMRPPMVFQPEHARRLAQAIDRAAGRIGEDCPGRP